MASCHLAAQTLHGQHVGCPRGAVLRYEPCEKNGEFQLRSFPSIGVVEELSHARSCWRQRFGKTQGSPLLIIPYKFMPETYFRHESLPNTRTALLGSCMARSRAAFTAGKFCRALLNLGNRRKTTDITAPDTAKERSASAFKDGLQDSFATVATGRVGEAVGCVSKSASLCPEAVHQCRQKD